MMSGLKRFFSLWRVSIMFSICLVFSGVLMSLMVVIDDIADDLQTTTAVIGITIALHVIPFGITGPLTSYALDFVGCRPVIMLGGVFLSSGIFLMAFAQNIAFIGVGFSLLGGIGASAIYTASTATIRKHYSYRHYALANGAAITGIPISIFIFSPVLRAIASTYGWRGALVIASAVSLNSVVIGALVKPGIIRERVAVISDDGRVRNVNDGEDDVDDVTDELLLRPPLPDHQPMTTVLESTESNDQGSSARVAKDYNGSVKNHISSHPRISLGIPVPGYGDREHDASDDDIDAKKVEVHSRAILNADDELHSGISLTNDKGTFQSTVSGTSHVSCCSLSSDDNDLPHRDQKPCNDPKGAKTVKSAFRMSDLFRFSAKPLTKTTKICHVALLVAIFLLAATYTTGHIFITPAGTRGGLSPMQAASLLSVFGVSQAVGRFCNGILVTKGFVKAEHLFLGAQILMASSSLVLGLLMRVYVVAIVGSLAFGVSSGAIISLNIVMQRVIDECATSISLGWLLFIEGFGGLFGSLALGYLKDFTDSFMLMFVLAGVFTSLSAALTVLIIILKKREAVSLRKYQLSNKEI